MTTPPANSQPRPSRVPPILMFLTGTALFIAIAADVAHHGKLAQVDQVIAPYLFEHSNYWLIMVASAFSGLGEFWLLLPFAVLVGVGLIWRRRWRALGIWAAGLLASPLICGMLKAYFAIPRPSRYTSYAWDKHGGFTFPSGHTMGAMITAGLTALLWMHLRPRSRGRRVAVAAGVGLLGTLVAGALLYVGVHYLTDVLAGMAGRAAFRPASGNFRRHAGL